MRAKLLRVLACISLQHLQEWRGALVAGVTSEATTQSSVIIQVWGLAGNVPFFRHSKGPCGTRGNKDHTHPSPFVTPKLKITGFYWLSFCSALILSASASRKILSREAGLSQLATQIHHDLDSGWNFCPGSHLHDYLIWRLFLVLYCLPPPIILGQSEVLTSLLFWASHSASCSVWVEWLICSRKSWFEVHLLLFVVFWVFLLGYYSSTGIAI